MKIAVTSQNFRTVTGHAGRARRFLVYDAEPDAEPVEVERLDLPKELAMHDFQGGGPHPVDAFDVILSGGFGEGFARRLGGRGVTVVLTKETDPLAAVKAYLTDPAAMRMTSCGGHGHTVPAVPALAATLTHRTQAATPEG
jgi:predicted Fe-Mo cluster-binding NifX family protein